MKLSLITVCYNSESTIETTFKSIASQSYKNIEYIVVDGGSNDGTLKLIEKYSSIITKSISESDNGLYDAMNKGISIASGEIIGFLNSDDLFSDINAIQKIINVFENNKIDSVYANLNYVSKYNTEKIVRKWKTGNKQKFKYGWHPAHPSLYIKREVYIRHGLFDLDFKIAADFELMLRYFERYNITTKYLNESIINMRLGGESNKSIKNIIQQNGECIKAFKKNNVSFNIFLYPFYRLIPKLLQFKN